MSSMRLHRNPPFVVILWYFSLEHTLVGLFSVVFNSKEWKTGVT